MQNVLSNRRFHIAALVLFTGLCVALLLPANRSGAVDLPTLVPDLVDQGAVLVGRKPSSDTNVAPACTVFVRDLADGSPVADLTLHYQTSSGAEHVQSGADGSVQVPDDSLATLSSGDASWHLANRTPERYGEEQTIWAWRHVPLDGSLACEIDSVPNDLQAVILQAHFAGHPQAERLETLAPWNLYWLQRHGVPVNVQLSRPTPTGEFRGEIPCIMGFGVRAKSDECETAWDVVELDANTIRVRTRLTLVPRATVRGVARGADGAPLRNAEVRAYVVRRKSVHEFRQGQLRLELENGFTASWLAEEDRAVSTTSQRVFTDSQGRFVLPLRTRGDVWLVAYADHHTAFEASLGYVSGNQSEIEFEMTSGVASRIRVEEDGRSLAKTRFTVADTTLEHVFATRNVTSDEHGEISARWMHRGRGYLIAPVGGSTPFTRRSSRYFLWNGQRVLELSELPDRPE